MREELAKCAWSTTICVRKLRAEIQILNMMSKPKSVTEFQMSRIKQIIQPLETSILTLLTDFECVVIDASLTRTATEAVNALTSTVTKVWIHVAIKKV